MVPPDQRAALQIVEIKEKFGRLNIYVRHDFDADLTERIHDLTQEIGIESSRTCQVCGQPGKRGRSMTG